MRHSGMMTDHGAIMTITNRPRPLSRKAFSYARVITTRWMDNDVYGHVNNVVYYSFFDTVVNGYLIEQKALDPMESPVIGLVVETQCQYFRPIAFPDSVTAALRVDRLGNSSVHYAIALFCNDEMVAAAQGRFVHVYVDRITRRPVSISDRLRAALNPLISAPDPLD